MRTRPISYVALHAVALAVLLALSLAMLATSADEQAQTDDADDVILGQALSPCSMLGRDAAPGAPKTSSAA